MLSKGDMMTSISKCRAASEDQAVFGVRWHHLPDRFVATLQVEGLHGNRKQGTHLARAARQEEVEAVEA